MIGFLIGTACLIALVKVVRHGHHGYGRWHRGHHGYGGYGGYGYDGGGGACDSGGGCGPGGGGGGWGHAYRDGGFGGPDEGDDFGPRFRRRGGFGGPPWARGGFGKRFFLRRIFSRLETTPGQEKEIQAAIEELRSQARSAKDEVKGAREDIAKAMRGESFDEVALGGATARLETAVDVLRKAGISAFARVHGALDDKQRQTLADLIERGPRGFAY